MAGVLAPPSSFAQTQCPDNFVAFRGVSAPLSCTCPADATGIGYVEGMDVYAEDSGICQAAVHAGVITAKGGNVTVMPMPGQRTYAGVTRNGISSSNGGASDGSFSFAAAAAAAPPAAASKPAPVPASSPATASQCPDNFVAFRGTDAPLTCGCPEAATGIGYVEGMDVYPEDSGVCQAAVHAGVITAKGGNVSVVPMPGQGSYAGVTRNGISSSNAGMSDGSFRFAPVAAAVPPAVIPVVAPSPATASQCPDNFVAFRGTEAPLACGCPEDATGIGYVEGMDVYAEDSGICQAAVHAGVITAKGGNVSVVPMLGQRTYAGVTRNGISSSNGGASDGSFRFGVAGAAAAAPVAPQAAASAGPICPDNFVAYRGATGPLSCTCTDAATAVGYVEGMDVYTDDSGICQAAVHAGVITRRGGGVSVVPMPGQRAYPGVTRNGISSSNGGAAEGSFRFGAAAGPVLNDGVPAQQPIAVSLQQSGQVQLYITFAFDSAEIDGGTTPVLDELLGVLRTEPGLRLSLIGHTDAVGQADYNLALSGKRAETVKRWLVQHGIQPSRLETSGRGATEPIGDNATDDGRALNRRVQALRLG